MAEEALVPVQEVGRGPDATSQAIYSAVDSGELAVAVVGHVGSGTSTIATVLKEALESGDLPGGPFDTTVLKARAEILRWAETNKKELPPGEETELAYVSKLQDLGDEMRASLGHDAVARSLISRIRETRATKQNASPAVGAAVVPDGKRRAYILDSLRHPAEVSLIRQLYRPAFALVGVVCDTGVRKARISKKFKDAGDVNAADFMDRDEDEGIKHGQRVADTFHLADYFINNTEVRLLDNDLPNPEWDVAEQLGRLIKVIQQEEVVRPRASETAMHAAYGAKVRSACLSRQVGACLVDASGTIVSTGTNEVPRGGGGLYPGPIANAADHRCAYRTNPHCSNTREQNAIVEELLASLGIPEPERTEATKTVRSGRVGRLLEFSRAVHAEMEALLCAGRSGRSTLGTTMFVTTFPCHYCARHLVSAGVDEVQYIEPYSKSQALSLHGDAITATVTDWKAPSQGGTQVLFRPFTGVAPRLYERAFVKDRELKNKQTGDLHVHAPEWGGSWVREKVSYTKLEAEFAKVVESE